MNCGCSNTRNVSPHARETSWPQRAARRAEPCLTPRRSAERRRSVAHQALSSQAPWPTSFRSMPPRRCSRGATDDAVLDTWIFGGARGLVDAVWSGGRKVVSEGRHISRERIATRFAAVLRRLAERGLQGETMVQAADESSPSPPSLHAQILADIEGRILSGEWQPGHRIPYEHELTEQYDCSRMTVSKALTQLMRAGPDRAAAQGGQLRRSAAQPIGAAGNPRRRRRSRRARPALRVHRARTQPTSRDTRRPRSS